MKVFLSADIEGCTGLVSWSQAGRPSSEHYDWRFAREMMTHDVNAAIRGARKGGATHITVKDSHNTGKNLLIDMLEPSVHLISGTGVGWDGMMEGVAGHDRVFLIGYHAMAGTPSAIMEHTLTGRIHRLWIDGQEQGEIGISALTAGQYGLPIHLVVSDDKGCAEAQRVTDGVMTCETKTSFGRYMGEVVPPSVTGLKIEAAAAAAMRVEAAVWRPLDRHEVILECTTTTEGDAVSRLNDWSRLDGYRLVATGSWQHVHRAIYAATKAMASANQD